MLSLGYFIFIYLGNQKFSFEKFNSSGNSFWGRRSRAGISAFFHREHKKKKTEVKEPPSLLLHIHGNLKAKALGIYRKYGFPREAMAVFLLLSDSPADFDILCCGSFSSKLKFNRLLFMHEIFNQMVCVNDRQP